MSTDELRSFLDALPLIDHHVHGAYVNTPSLDEFVFMLTESDRPAPPGTTPWQSQLGFAIRRWCGPALGLETHVSAEEYMTYRLEADNAEVTRALLTQSGIERFLLDTGFRGEAIHGVAGMGSASDGARVDEIVRLEPLAEELAASGVPAEDFPDRFVELLAERTRDAVGLKSIIAYRYGLDFDPQRPTRTEVVRCVGAWLREISDSHEVRVSDPVLLRFLIWSGVDRALPLQFHVGYGDPDLQLDRCDPLKMTAFLSDVDAYNVPMMLLHTYPFQRHAGYLAQMFTNVYMDVGLGINYAGARSTAVIAESMELAPFSKVLFSSDAWGLPELHFLGARLWREGMTSILKEFVDLGAWSLGDAKSAAVLMASENAVRVYDLDGD